MVVILVLTLVGAGTALAGRYDPQRRITPADQARARAMLVKQVDLATGFQRLSGSLTSTPTTCKALDESDLTLTGEAGSSLWLKGTMFVFSAAKVYASTAQANASWTRQTSRAGRDCAVADTTRVMGLGGSSVSLVTRAFPRLAPRTVSYRVTITSQSGVSRYMDVVALQRSRGQAIFVVGSGGTSSTKALEVRLGRILAARMSTALRGP